MRPAFVGVDVGTGSARVGVFDGTGAMLVTDSEPITTSKRGLHVEQRSEDVWRAVCTSCRRVVSALPADVVVKSLAFDATCSLVIEEDGGDLNDVIVWMDHRAEDQAARINKKNHEVLKYVGGTISPEMETPKLLWLKENQAERFKRARRFFDLPDWLTFKATGKDSRSLCSTTCKWTYTTDGWSDSFFRSIGLEELAEESWARIGTTVLPLGDPVGPLVSADLGLPLGITVAVSVIDAHAGGLGVLGASVGDKPINFDNRLAIICGTSCCHMAVSPEPRFVQGVWGPYHNAMVPSLWLNEAGQSAAGSFLDYIVDNHSASVNLGVDKYADLNECIKSIELDQVKHIHILPDVLGNRSPLADARLRGAIVGIEIDTSLDNLARLYLAAVQALAYGTRHIVETLNEKGYSIDHLLVTGGLAKNRLYLQQHADICGCPVVLARQPEAVLLGCSMMGAVACGEFSSIPKAMASMSQAGETVHPQPEVYETDFHDKKYKVFRMLLTHQQEYLEIMNK